MFNTNVRGKIPDSSLSNQSHDGRNGHWLETQMNIAHNAANLPDILGYEMKNNTNQITTFGDWSADYYIYKDDKYGIGRNDFIRIFGKPNHHREGRYSWSGDPCPKTINKLNNYGQIMLIDGNNNVDIVYYFSKDNRADKDSIVPTNLQLDNLTIASWKGESLKKHLEDKFNVKGWFKCLQDKNGIYTSIVFGDPIKFEKWLADIKLGKVYFDSGMHQGNSRNYSFWRAKNSYWQDLITETY